jgi:hypothetical protein
MAAGLLLWLVISQRMRPDPKYGAAESPVAPVGYLRGVRLPPAGCPVG